MLDKSLDFIIQYFSGFFIVLIVTATFIGCLYLASLKSDQNAPQTSERTKLCWLLRSDNCF